MLLLLLVLGAMQSPPRRLVHSNLPLTEWPLSWTECLHLGVTSLLVYLTFPIVASVNPGDISISPSQPSNALKTPE